MLSLYRGRWVDPREAPELDEVLAELARRAGLRWVPRAFYIPSRAMNAFATGGPDDAVVAISDGLLRGLRPRELTAVLAHEVSHIANEDVQVMAFADLVSRIASLLGLAGQVLLVLSLPLLLLGGVPIPWLGILIQMSDPSVLRTHPETGERMARLLELEAHADGYGSPSSPLHRPGRTPGPARPGTRLGATPAPPGALVLSPRTRRGYPAAHPSGRLRISR